MSNVIDWAKARLNSRDSQPDIRNRSPPDNRMDWDATNENFTRGDLHFEKDGLHLDTDFEDVRVDIHVHKGTVELHIADQATDDWRQFVVGIEPDEIDDLIAQLQCAKEYSDGKMSDIRIGCGEDD